MAIALDPASSEFRRQDGRYQVAGQKLTSAEMIERYSEIVERFPVWLIEDGLAEDDWYGWAALTEQLGGRVQLVGDDLFVTNPAVIADAIDRGVAKAALIRLNQIGTVSEALEAMTTCRRGGYPQLIRRCPPRSAVRAGHALRSRWHALAAAATGQRLP